MVDVHFWRQVFILSSGIFSPICIGYMMTFPSVLNPSLLAPNGTDIRATPEQASWLAACNGLAGAVGFFILSPIVQLYGRKAFHVVFNIFMVIGWCIFPIATDITTLFLARTIQGLSTGGFFIQSMIVCEYVHPKRRGYFITVKKMSMVLGTLGCHLMALIWDWRQISMFCILLPSLSIFFTILWPESPYYLAMKGRFRECEKSFLWLNGTSLNDELQELISAQKKQLAIKKAEQQKIDLKAYLKKDFLKPFCIASILTLLLDLFGRYYFMAYAIQIMVELIGDKSIAIYLSIATDCITIFATIICCFLISYIERRTMIIVFSCLSICLMLTLSLLVFLKRYGHLEGVVWICPLLYICQNFIVNAGIFPVSYTLIGEVFPLEHKGVGSCATGVVYTLFYALTVKITPTLMLNTGLDGTFALFGFSSLVCLVVLYFIIPKTKDKTLQQIEDSLKGKTIDNPELNYEKNNLLYVEVK